MLLKRVLWFLKTNLQPFQYPTSPRHLRHFVTSLSLSVVEVREFDRIPQKFVTSARFTRTSSLRLYTVKARHLGCTDNNHVTAAIRVDCVQSIFDLSSTLFGGIMLFPYLERALCSTARKVGDTDRFRLM
jgi:hypothetical protein